MHLTPEEVKQFYGVWVPLLNYVNEQRGLVDSFPKIWKPGRISISPEVAVILRDALWEDDTLRTSFVVDNPANLSAADLALVHSWQHRVEGDFWIYRHTKQYTVLLTAGDELAGYAVHGVTDSLAEMLGDDLPIYASTVLLPFGDRIIYDSLMLPYAIHFGPGIRRSLNEAYHEVQERGGLITRLPSGGEDEGARVQAGNQRVLAAFHAELRKANLSAKKVREHVENLTAFVHDYLLVQEPPNLLLDLTPSDLEGYGQVCSGKVNWVSFKRFVRFLRDTMRTEWEEAEAMLDLIKHKQRG